MLLINFLHTKLLKYIYKLKSKGSLNYNFNQINNENLKKLTLTIKTVK